MSRPSIEDYATYEESAFPGLWQGVVGAWAPCLGPTGLRLHDFSQSQLWGTLTNMDAAADWQTSRGVYALRTTGTDTAGSNATQDRVEIAYDYGALNVLTFSAWVWPVTLNKRGICTTGPNYSQPRFAITLLTTGQLETFRGANTNSTASISAGQWNFFSVSNNSLVTRYHINGKFDSQSNQTIGFNAQTNFQISNNYWGAFEGFLAFAVIHNRILSTDEHILLNTIGPGGIFQRRKRRYSFEQPAAPTFKNYWLQKSRSLIGGGVK